MAGDDFNDALACADVGIAMGTRTDVGMNSAQLKLVKGDLRGHATSTIFSVAAVVNMKQNPAFAFVYNALGRPSQRRHARPGFKLADIALAHAGLSRAGAVCRRPLEQHGRRANLSFWMASLLGEAS
jgi:cation transport ATPase